MTKLQKVVITKEIVRPYGGCAEPEVGMTGYIVKDNDTPANHTCVRFLSTALGYEYDPETDDKDYKYIRVYVPNENFEKVEGGIKNKEVKLPIANNSLITNKMQQPEILRKSGNGWQILYGHCCFNQKEMENYVNTLDPNGNVFKIVDLKDVQIDPNTSMLVEAKPKNKIK